ncbi:hypothetical protein EUX98_g3186 [Antrodiella citrinella]|uniref:Phytocyanin domain-containing protein n=1 Tax=Antrodiella citrinella TaxID=2447956 RepID=A0A4S4MX68_9APHY|nr:hypothetical protein EUX98_g3186 [Antrodiella citrinella]
MFFPRLAFITALVGVVASQNLEITNPDADHWWVASSINTLAWTCQNTTFPTFTVLIGNPSANLQAGAFIAIQNNFDCSKTITQDLINQGPGTGYVITFANPLNNTDVYATSAPFEIKPLGSAYPTSASSQSPSATSSGSSSSATPTSQGNAGKSNDATGLKTAFGGIFAAAAAIGFTLV